MNAGTLINALMKQASNLPKTQSTQAPGEVGASGMDVGSLVSGLAKQLGGGASTSGGGSGFDLKSALGGGALGMLLGSKRSKGLGKKALKYGALAGAGMLAYRAYQNYQQQADSQAAGARQGDPIERLNGPAQEQRGQEILQAMIMAARADGHIDEAEHAQLTTAIAQMGADAETQRWVEAQFNAPLDAAALAAKASSPQAAREMYLVSVAMIDEQNPMERAWLDQLGSALQLEPALRAEIERQVAQAA